MWGSVETCHAARHDDALRAGDAGAAALVVRAPLFHAAANLVALAEARDWRASADDDRTQIRIPTPNR